MSWTEWTESIFRNLDLRQLKVDEAYLNISNQNSVKHYLYSLSIDCVKCPFRLIKTINGESEELVTIDTARKLHLSLYSKNQGLFAVDQSEKDKLWSLAPDVGEFGVYDLIIRKNGSVVFMNANEPVSTVLRKFLWISIAN